MGCIVIVPQHSQTLLLQFNTELKPITSVNLPWKLIILTLGSSAYPWLSFRTGYPKFDIPFSSSSFFKKVSLDRAPELITGLIYWGHFEIASPVQMKEPIAKTLVGKSGFQSRPPHFIYLDFVLREGVISKRFLPVMWPPTAVLVLHTDMLLAHCRWLKKHAASSVSFTEVTNLSLACGGKAK